MNCIYIYIMLYFFIDFLKAQVLSSSPAQQVFPRPGGPLWSDKGLMQPLPAIHAPETLGVSKQSCMLAVAALMCRAVRLQIVAAGIRSCAVFLFAVSCLQRIPKAAAPAAPASEMNGSTRPATGPVMKVLYGSNSGSSNLTASYRSNVI